MKKAVIYARYSAGSGQTDQSIEGQVRECRQYIENHKMKLIEIYADRHITGRTDRRPEFQRMISDAESGAFDAVVVYTTDRFSRSRYDSIAYKKQLKDLGIQICYAAESIPDGPEGILLESLMEGWAQYYSEELSRKISRGMHDSATKCKATGSVCPIGYRVNAKKQYEIDPDTSEYVVRAFNMYLEGNRFADISRYFAEHGLLTGSGNPFSGQAIRRMLTNRRYIGEYHWHDVTIEDGMPVIVSKELFYMVQKKIQKDHPPKAKSAEYYLSGKLFCGLCGSKYKGVSGTGKSGKKYYYYKCSCKECDAPKIPARELETFIADEVSAAMRDPEMLDLIADKLHLFWENEEKTTSPSADDPQKRLARVERQLDALVYNLSQRPGSDALLNKLDELEAEREELRAQIAIAGGEKKSEVLSREALREGVDAFLAGFSFDEPETTTKRILDGFVRKAVKKENKILVELNLSGVDPLELEDLSMFDQKSNWWTKSTSGRTFICGPAVVLIIDYAA